MPESINSKLKEQYDHDDSGGSLDTNLGDFLDSEGASGTSNNSKWRDWASGTGTSLNTRLFHKHGGSGSFMTRWKNWIAFSSTHSFNFDGSNDYLSLADSISLSGQFTISMWIYLDDNTSVNLFGDSSSSANFMWIDANNDIQIASSDLSITFTDSNMTTGSWQHILITRDGSNVPKFYKNGALVQTLSADAGTFTFDQIGAYHTGSNFFDGLIDEVAIWDTALSASDVTSIYNNGNVTDLSKSASYGTDRTGNLQLWLRCGDKSEPESNTAIARQDFYTDFDGSDDYISTNADSTLADATYTFWARSTQTGENNGVFGHGDEDIGAFHFNRQGTGKPLLFLGTNRYKRFVDNSAQDDGQWHHFAVILDSDDITGCKFYIDGVEQSSDASANSGDFNAYTSGIEIGRANSSQEWEGSMAQFAIYQTTLDAQTIKQFAKSRFTPMRDNRFSVVDFDGSNDFIDIPDNDALDAGSGDMTITFWYNPLSMSANMEIIDKYDTSSNKGYRVRHHNSTSKVWFNINDGADSDGYYSYIDVALSYGQWYHVTIIWDNSEQQATYYINGVNYGRAFSTSLRSIGDTSNSVPLRFGSTQAIGSLYKGSISSIAIYNVARTSEEDYACYQKGITHNPSADTGLVGLWRMGDDTSKEFPTIADSSSNSNDGTMTNMALEDIEQQAVAMYDMGSFEGSEVLGAEKVDNNTASAYGGGSESNIANVTNGVAITFAGVGTGLNATFSDASLLNTNIVATENKIHKLTFNAYYEGGSAGSKIRVYDTVTNHVTPSLTTTSTSYSLYFSSIHASMTFQQVGMTSGNVVYITDMSFKRVLQSEVSDTHPAIIDVNEPVLGAELIPDGEFTDTSLWDAGSDVAIGTGISFVNGQAVWATSGVVEIKQDITINSGKLYKVVLDIDSVTSGTIRNNVGSYGGSFTTAGVKTEYITGSGSRFYLVGFSGFNGVLNSVSVKEVQGNVGTMTNQATSDLVYSSVLPDQSFLIGLNSAYNFLDFDGSDAFVNCGGDIDVVGAFTISAWVNPDNFSYQLRSIASQGNSFFGFSDHAERRLMFQGQDSGANNLKSNTDLAHSTWHHIVLTVSGTNAGDGAIYVNGSRDDDGDSTVFLAAGDFVIGKMPNASSRYMNGKITQVAIYNKALTSTEVSGIYDLGRHGNLLDSYSDNLKGYWVMGGLDSKTGLPDTDSTIYDRSGNSNHGTTSGTATGDLKSPPNAEPNGYAKGDTNRSTTTP